MTFRRVVGLAAMATAIALAQSSGGYRVAGTLVNALTGEPVPGADVALQVSGQADQAPIGAKSDGEGRFVFDAMPAGRYRLTAWRRGYTRQALDEHHGWSTGVVTGEKLDTSHIVFRMKPGASIRIRVLDEDGELVRGARFYLFEKQTREGNPATQMVRAGDTQNQGGVRFSNIEPGTYYLAVVARPWYAQTQNQHPRLLRGSGPSDSAEDQQPAASGPSPFDVAYPLTWYGGATDYASATPIRLEAGQTVAADINLQPVQAIQIRLDDPPSADTKSPQPMMRRRFAQVMAEGPDGVSIPVNAVGQENGRDYLLLGGLAPGHYQVDYNEFDPTGKLQRQRRLSVDAMGNTRISADVPPLLVMDGKVESDQPITAGGISIRLREWPNGVSRGFLAADGTLNFSSYGIERNKQYEVYTDSSSGLLITSLAAEGAKVAGRVLTTADSDVHLKLSVVHVKLTTVDGFVLRNDEPAPGVAVYLLPQDAAARATGTIRDQSNTDGSFTMAGVMPGSYYAIAVENGFDLMYANAEAMSPYLAQAQKVKVDRGQKQEIKINVQPLR